MLKLFSPELRREIRVAIHRFIDTVSSLFSASSDILDFAQNSENVKFSHHFDFGNFPKSDPRGYKKPKYHKNSSEMNVSERDLIPVQIL